MSNQQQQIDSAKLWQAMNSFAGRMAETDDPKKHQEAGRILQREVKACKVGK